MLSLISSTIRSMYVYHAWSDIIPLMPSYRFNCMCLQFLFLYTSSCYSFSTSASLWLSFCCLLLLLCVCLYDVSYARLFFGGKILFYFIFFEKKLKTLIFAQARRFNGFLFTSSCILRSFCLKISFIINCMLYEKSLREKGGKKNFCLELLRKFISKYDDALPLKFGILIIIIF